jgi:osmoprotectant transport system ATP-binding protein
MANAVDESNGQGSAIVFAGVSKVYPNATKPSVDNVSLTVDPGKFVVLLGPSGCGKTTLLKMVNRLYEPSSGTITIDGQDIRSISASRLRRGIGYVIQQTGLFPHMRIEANIAVVPSMLGWDKHRISARVDELLVLVGLPPEDYRRRYPSQLSGGEQQRVGLARAMAADPSMMLMDEPFGALDAITRTRLQDELLRIHRTIKKTVLFVTHDIEEAVRLADAVVIMREGKVVQFDTPLNIVMHPADDFVRDLVGADDVLRRLSLIKIGEVMSAVGERSETTIAATDNLRHALGHLMESGTSEVTVVDGAGTAVGQIGLSEILKASAVSGGAES